MERISLQEDIRPLSEFRAHVAGFIEHVRESHRPLLITHRGRSTAVLLDVAQYEALIDQLELLREIQAGERQIDAGQGIPHRVAKQTLLARLKK